MRVGRWVWRWRTAVAVVVSAVMAALVAVAVVALIEGTQATAQSNAELLLRIEQLEVANRDNVIEHRERNQSDHDCLLQLALELSDPTRDRSLPLPLPECAAHLVVEEEQ